MKNNPELGKKVHEHLVSIGLETPMTEQVKRDNNEKVAFIEDHFRQIMELLGLDLKDDSLIDTPKRVSKMFVNEIFWGLDYNQFPKATTVENKMRYDEMVVERNITVNSNCEHHFVIIDGFAHVAYMPKDKVLGLSKLNRIVEFFAKRPQIQERLTAQIAHALMFILETDDVAVMVDAVHYCVKSRGVMDSSSSTATSFMGGKFREDPALKAEFLNVVRSNGLLR